MALAGTQDSTAPTSSSRADSARPTPNKADAPANKINSWAVVGSVFLAIGLVASSIAGLGLNHILIQASIHTLDFALGAGVISTAIAVISFFIAYMDSNSNDNRSNTQNHSSVASTPSSPGKPSSADPKAPGRSGAPRGGSAAHGSPPAPPYIHKEVVGIQNNQGLNNCWINSLLQILLNSEDLKQSLKNIPAFKKFIDRYDLKRNGSNVTLNAQEIREYLSENSDIASESKTEDLHEPLNRILELLRSKNPGLQNSLYTYHHYEYADGRPNEVSSIKDENNGIIGLPESSNDNLQARLSEYFHSPQNQVVVEERKLVLEERKLAFAPKDLFFHIQRYLHQDMLLAVPQNFSLEATYLEDNKSKDYELKGFAVFLSGHYISYVKKADQWYMCNDSTVEKASEEEALTAAILAYIVHYERKN